ncbi:MAG: ABC transporter permease [Oscillatoriales cyanobacterium SM2_1_8]|nr:ABC transporter permease [Oscillatoriales cyanobacterium SM2_1_8]
MNWGRIWAVATNAIRETLREQVLYLLLLFLFLLVAAATLLPMFSSESADKLIVDTGLAAIEVVGLLVAIFVGTGAIERETNKRTIFILIAKPLSRAEFLLGKHLGISLVLALLIALMSLIFLGFAQLRQIPLPWGAVAIACGFIFVKLFLVTAFALFFGSFSGALLATMVTFGTYLFGNITEDIRKLGAIAGDEGVQRVTEILYLMLPNLARADLKNEAVYGVLPPPEVLLGDGVYILAYTCLVLAGAMLVFANRQF